VRVHASSWLHACVYCLPPPSMAPPPLLHHNAQVYIHGGGYLVGGASVPLYQSAALAATGPAVVVLIQYRLGVFGCVLGRPDCCLDRRAVLCATLLHMCIIVCVCRCVTHTADTGCRYAGSDKLRSRSPDNSTGRGASPPPRLSSLLLSVSSPSDASVLPS
jgi:hypothetical protein